MQSAMFRKSVRARALTTVSSVALAAHSFLSGYAAYAAEADQAAAVEEVVVTGSRITREGYEAPTPLTVMNLDALENTATANVADVLKDMPVFSGLNTPTSQQGSVSAGNAGTNTLNLRSLGASRTLVLMDGHRTVGSNASGNVDVNTLPQNLIARVDVVTGGASAVYGSDAVAGVTNFILDKTFTGLKGEISGGETQYKDDRNYKISVAGGFNFGGGRGHLLISGEQNATTGIVNGSNGRAWDLQGVQSIANPAYVATCAPGTCQPFYISSNHVGMSTLSAGGLITSGPLKGTAFGPGGVPYQFNYGSTFSAPLMIGGDWASNQTAAQYSSLDNKSDRQAVFVRAAYDVTDDINVYAQASWNHAYSFGGTLPGVRQGSSSTNAAYYLDNAGQPGYVGVAPGSSAAAVPCFGPTGQYAAATNQVGVACSNIIKLGLRVDNPFIPAAVAAKIPAGVTLLQLGSYSIDGGIESTVNDRRVQRAVVGADGKFDAFDRTWAWDLYAQYGKSMNSVNAGVGNNNEVRWTQAVDAVRDPNTGRIVCRSTLTVPNDGCVPFNVLGVGVNSEAAIKFIQENSHMNQDLVQKVFSGTLTGSPLDLWAGPVDIAVNVEHRNEKVFGWNSLNDLYRAFKSGDYQPTFGSYSVTEGALEVDVPLAKDMPWAVNWDLNTAVRATNYSTSGYVTTWKVGSTYTPIDDIKFRGTYSRDIRAPNLSELFNPGANSTGNNFDPFSNTTHQIKGATVGNLDLKPEIATTLGIGGVFQPSFVPGLSLSVDYWDVKIKDQIGSVGQANVMAYCYQGQQVYCNAILFATPGTHDIVVTVTNTGFNIAKAQNTGIDLAATYRLPMDAIMSDWAGNLTFSNSTTFYTKNYLNDSINPPTDTIGQNSNSTPKWKTQMGLSYNNDPIKVAFTARGVSAGTIVNSYVVCAPGTCPVSTINNRTVSTILGGTLTGTPNHVPGAWYFDLATSYKFLVGEETEVEAFFNVKNVANTDPVLIPVVTGTPHSYHAINSDLYDTFGRTYRAGVRFKM